MPVARQDGHGFNPAQGPYAAGGTRPVALSPDRVRNRSACEVRQPYLQHGVPDVPLSEQTAERHRAGKACPQGVYCPGRQSRAGFAACAGQRLGFTDRAVNHRARRAATRGNSSGDHHAESHLHPQCHQRLAACGPESGADSAGRTEYRAHPEPRQSTKRRRGHRRRAAGRAAAPVPGSAERSAVHAPLHGLDRRVSGRPAEDAADAGEYYQPQTAHLRGAGHQAIRFTGAGTVGQPGDPHFRDRPLQPEPQRREHGTPSRGPDRSDAVRVSTHPASRGQSARSWSRAGKPCPCPDRAGQAEGASGRLVVLALRFALLIQALDFTGGL